MPVHFFTIFSESTETFTILRDKPSNVSGEVICFGDLQFFHFRMQCIAWNIEDLCSAACAGDLTGAAFQHFDYISPFYFSEWQVGDLRQLRFTGTVRFWNKHIAQLTVCGEQYAAFYEVLQFTHIAWPGVGT